jgi:hypothetical protein
VVEEGDLGIEVQFRGPSPAGLEDVGHFCHPPVGAPGQHLQEDLEAHGALVDALDHLFPADEEAGHRVVDPADRRQQRPGQQGRGVGRQPANRRQPRIPASGNTAAGDGDVGIVEGLEQPGDRLRRVLKVAVEDAERVPPGRADALDDGRC